MVTIIDMLISPIAITKIFKNYFVGLNFSISLLQFITNFVYFVLTLSNILLKSRLGIARLFLRLRLIYFHLFSCQTTIMELIFSCLHTLYFVILLIIWLSCHLLMSIKLHFSCIPFLLFIGIFSLPLFVISLAIQLWLFFDDSVAW